MKLPFFAFLTIATASLCLAGSINDSFFPLENYDQRVSRWIDPSDPSYDQELLGSGIQEQRKNELFDHLFGSLSPWSEDCVKKSLSGSSIKLEEEQFFAKFGVADKYYGSDEPNGVPYPPDWLTAIQENSDLAQLDHLSYTSSKRGILIQNCAARVLPTEQFAFLKSTSPGEGYPFDYLQMSTAYLGTPLYVIATTQDGLWDLVLTPDFLAWVKSENVALISQEFINTWSAAAKKQLIAITQTAVPLNDEKNNLHLLMCVGTCFPQGTKPSTIILPRVDSEGNALIQEEPLVEGMGVPLPWSLTPHHMAMLMNTLIGRPYRWGGIGNEFDNDCSAELKNLFLPFGIYLPRNSSEQVTAGLMTDKSSSPADQRIEFLKKEGKPFLSLIYIGGHVMLYIGTYPNPNDQENLMAMTYQNLWGLRPTPPFIEDNPDKRFIIGKSAFLPLLLQYPEEPTAVSLAAKPTFQICDLSQFPLLLLQSSGMDLSALQEKERRSQHLHLLMTPERIAE
ncbi:MAG: SH3 domain-containing protein [Chthoniobacterales bacterium]|nr:SH3 domain-containing protein [Chthoniobacterales bacterium]